MVTFTQKNIVITGPGAMGCLFAGMLLKAGQRVWLLAKNDAVVASIRRSGLAVEGGEKPLHMPFTSVTSDPSEPGSADVLIVCVKAYDTAAAIKKSLPAVGEKTTVVSLQNGLGNLESISGHIAKGQILGGTTAHGATLLGPGRVRHAGSGDTVIGPLAAEGRQRAIEVRDIFTAAGIDTTVADDITSVLWGKLLVNACINPLTAIMGIKNGRIPDSPHLMSIMEKAAGEVIAVAEKKGIALPFPDPVEKAESVCRATAENISSMLQDVRAGRQTEIESINGAVAACGEALNVPTPVNRMLTDLVKSVCNSKE